MNNQKRQELLNEARHHIEVMLGAVPATFVERDQSILRLRAIIEELAAAKSSGRRAKNAAEADQTGDGTQAPHPPDA